jgi:putative ABC transport system permease protein
MAQETMFATENGLRMAIAFAVLIATFIIYNTFQMAVGERRRQLGILRAVGATRSQVMWMILREALWISLAGSVAGCLLGIWGANYLNQVTELLMVVQLPNTQLTPLPFVIAVAMGITVSLLGAFIPARRASQVDPLEAMRSIEVRHNDEVIRQATPLGVLLIPAGLGLLGLAVYDFLPLGGDVVAIVAILLGCVLLMPVLLQPCSHLLAGALQQPWGSKHG